MEKRLKLQQFLEEIIGSRNVYFQPPESVKLRYPCIIYSLNYMKHQYADNRPYQVHNRYLVCVIDKNPDSTIPRKIAALPLCSFDRSYIADNLYHTVFNLYY